MQFSILIPTCNRLELLKYAIETVRRQDFEDWEIVVSDNCSDEDVIGYLESTADSRIKYFRTDNFVSVNENWNNALEHSSGNYVLMLGDDDGLVNGYFRTMNHLIDRFSEPDVIYTSGYVYAYPGVVPGCPEGYLHPSGCAKFLQFSEEPFFLELQLARRLVNESFHFKLRFDFNMQYSTMSRSFIDSASLRGHFFQSSFPDFYATNVEFLRAKRILIYPHPMVVIGISPKSYGFYHFNARDREGAQFLTGGDFEKGNLVPNKLGQVLLPGPNMNTSWLDAMETIRANYGSEIVLRIGHNRYRSLQILDMFEKYFKSSVPRLEFLKFRRQMRLWERALYGGAVTLAVTLGRTFQPHNVLGLTWSVLRIWKKALAQMPSWKPDFYPGQYNNVLEVFEQLNS